MWSLKLLFLCVFVVLVQGADEEYDNCSAANCKLPKCRCSDTLPSVNGTKPQLVALSFDDSVSKLISDSFYETDLFTRKNPDGCPISGTFFVPHEYTDYTVVNKLYNKGFEIGSHSITKNYSIQYWNNASAELIQKELEGQKKIISKFANIPSSAIIGARIPHFQLNGDHTYDGLASGFLYDNSWTTLTNRPMFPYTLDYPSNQQCLIGTCPQKAHPGFWILPINNWKGMDGYECNKLLGCIIEGDTDELFDWMMINFQRSYNSSMRAPVNLNVNYSWLIGTENSLAAFRKFLDHIKTLKDVYVVSNEKVLEWIKNPVPVGKFSSCPAKHNPAACTPVNCKLKNEQGSDRYMGSCVQCPKRYPGLDNNEGKVVY